MEVSLSIAIVVLQRRCDSVLGGGGKHQGHAAAAHISGTDAYRESNPERRYIPSRPS